MAIYLDYACQLFFTDRDTYCSDHTVSNYINTLGYFVRFMESRLDMSAALIDVSSISIHDLNAYSIYLKNKIKNDNNPFFKQDSNVKISARTRKDYLKDVKSFFSFLCEHDYLSQDVSKKLKLPRVSAQPIEPVTNDEVHIIDDCYKIDTLFGSRNLGIIHCLLDEGMRSGEVQRLKISDVHFDENYIVIRNSKGGKGRIIPMARIVKKYLKRYIEDKRPDVMHEYVFCTDDGKPLTANAIKCLFARLRESSNIKRIYPHLLRHTFATSFILGGGSLELLRVYMGHSSIETTQKYLHIANNLQFCTNIYRLDKCFLSKFY